MTKKSRPTPPDVDFLVEEWVRDLVEVEGLSPEQAKEYRDHVLDFQRSSGLSDLTTAKREDIERYLEVADHEDEDPQRFLEEVERRIVRSRDSLGRRRKSSGSPTASRSTEVLFLLLNGRAVVFVREGPRRHDGHERKRSSRGR